MKTNNAAPLVTRRLLQVTETKTCVCASAVHTIWGLRMLGATALGSLLSAYKFMGAALPPFSHARTYGFDSFEGLPRDFTQNERREWHSGQYRADPRSALLRDLDSAEAPIHFVAGFFDKSLSEPGLVRRLDMGPAKYVDIDVDLYSSTVTLLDFLFSHRLLVPGTVVGYDDFWSTSCSADSPAVASPLTNGEGRAHLQAAHRFNVTFTCLAGGCRASHRPQEVKFTGHCGAFGAIFMVTSICNADSQRELTAGFQLSTEDIVSFKKHNPVCRTHWAKV